MHTKQWFGTLTACRHSHGQAKQLLDFMAGSGTRDTVVNVSESGLAGHQTACWKKLSHDTKYSLILPKSQERQRYCRHKNNISQYKLIFNMPLLKSNAEAVNEEEETDGGLFGSFTIDLKIYSTIDLQAIASFFPSALYILD